MKKHIIITAVMFFLIGSSVKADGLMIPSNNNYPKPFLKNRLTTVTVNITGLVAGTVVYQEFENEWTDSTDVVYSFPLPANARATKFLYWYDNKVYQAVLKVKEQAVNPGTGEGGIAAEVNEYIGTNGIKILLKGIHAGDIQKVQLHYISLLDYYQGKCTYDYPLNTGDFIKYPVEHLQFNFNVNSGTNITSFDIPSHPNFEVINSDENNLSLELIKPKAYLNSDLTFYYQVENTSMSVDFYSANSDTMDGHFALFVKPQSNAEPDSVFPKRIFFLLSNSYDLSGYKITQSITAIKEALKKLSEKDLFNIVLFNYNASSWKNEPVPATTENISQAENYLANINHQWGSDLTTGLKECLNQIPDASMSNIILAFTDNQVLVDPLALEEDNSYYTGIFPVVIGDIASRERLEMTAALNYGFVTYIDQNESIGENIERVYNLVSQPILTEVGVEFGQASPYELVPEKMPSSYAGSYFFVTGRYKNPGQSALSIAGKTVSDFTAYDFMLDFTTKTDTNKFAEYLWAKEMIDALERDIMVYGETQEKRARLIELSLGYNIRCRYTAYIADYETIFTGVETNKDNIAVPTSFLAGNYPNPFNPTTRIRFHLDDTVLGKTKLIKIYNLLGQLVAVIDISHLSSGWHEIIFNGKDMFGNNLASGVYLVQLQIQNRVVNSIKINLVK